MSYKEQLMQNGIVELSCQDFSDENLLNISSLFGKVVPGSREELVQILPAREKGNGPKGSFSFTKGYGTFPWHTDTAFYYLLCGNHVILVLKRCKFTTYSAHKKDFPRNFPRGCGKFRGIIS